MPPRKRGKSAAPSTTYRATSAAPKQQQFPGRKRAVRTYSRNTTRTLKQETLTQMDFVDAPSASALELELLEESQDEGGLEEEPTVEVTSVKRRQPKREQKQVEKKPRSNRRKSAGETLEPQEIKRSSKRRKTMGDSPAAASVSSSFHTQTLTQFLSNQDPDEKREDDELDWHVSDSEAGDDAGLILETPRKNKDVKTEASIDKQSVESKDEAKLVTPCGRDRKLEIPSSQSPLTPMLMRYSPAGPRESPLRRKSSPLRPNMTPILKSARKTPRLQVEDTFATTLGSSPTTPTARSAVATPKANTGKRLRFEIEGDKENITPGRQKPKSPKPPKDTSGRKPLQEVPDSDEDFDDVTDEAETPSKPPSARRDTGAYSTREETPCPILDENADALDPDETQSCYGDLGEETQAQLLSSEHASSRDLGEHDDENDETPRKPATQSAAPINLSSSQASQSSRRSTRLSKTSTPSHNTSSTQAETQFTPYTQGLESQRLPMDDIRALGPQTHRSDIMVSLHPEPLQNILDGTKDHEFRAWKIPQEVSRVWIYSTQPASELRYMCLLSDAKEPGEIVNEKGIGNADFNDRKKKFANYAYEILQIYELNNPVPLAEMMRKGWIKGAPQKYTFVLPAVVGELTANLRCALLGTEGTEDELENDENAPVGLPSSNPKVITESQELKAQLQSDGDYSTQSFHGLPSAAVADLIEQEPSHDPDQKNIFAKPPLPTKHNSGSTCSNTETPHASRASRYEALTRGSSSIVRTSQATTISQLSSSPGMSPEKSQHFNNTAASPLQRSRRGRSQQQSQQRASARKANDATTTTTTTRLTATAHSSAIEIIGSSSPLLPPSKGTGLKFRHDNDDDDEEDDQETANYPHDDLDGSYHDVHEDEDLGRGGVYLGSEGSSRPLLPDSLLLHDEEGDDRPPPIVWDSADEHSD